MYMCANCILVNIFFQIFYFQATLSSDNAQTAQRLPIRISEAKGLNPDVPNGILALAHPAASTTLPIGPNKMNPLHRVDMRSKRRVSPPAENKVVVINNLAGLKAYGRSNGFSKFASQLCPGGMIQDGHLRRVPIITHLSSRSRTRVSVESNSSIRSTALV